MKNVPQDLLEFIKTGNKFIIAGHKDPDGDCVGSQLALVSVLKRMGKEAIPCSAGPFKRTEVKPYEKFFPPVPNELRKMQVIITDCSSSERTGTLGPLLKGLPTALVDHHERGEYTEKPNPFPAYIDDKAHSCTILILNLIRALGLEPSREEAELLLFGLCTDTGFFRHADSEDAETFDAAAFLIRAGANPKETFDAIHGGKNLESRIFLGHILSRMESHFEGRLILSTEEYEETQRFGHEGRDSDTLYQLIQSIAGVEAIVIIRQENPDSCTVGFRSRDQVDVALVAQSLGGGGHKNAAGAAVAGTIPELRIKILEAFQNIFLPC